MGYNMVTASHYILRDVLDRLDEGATKRLGETCNCYATKYGSDQEFQGVVDQILLAMENGNGTLEELRPRINELMTRRRISFYGSLRLWPKMDGLIVNCP
jgi:hypothetical protein